MLSWPKSGRADIAAFLDTVGDVLHRPVDVLAKGALPRRAAAAHEGETRQAANGHAPLIAAVAEGPFVAPGENLSFGEPSQRPVDRLLGLRRDDIGIAASVEIGSLAARAARRSKSSRPGTPQDAGSSSNGATAGNGGHSVGLRRKR
jgi:hypothetical protein